jgi:clathrin heavy chain
VCGAQVAWMNGLMDFVFPYLIQFLKEYTGKVDLLYTERKERQSAAVDEESAKKQQEAQSNAYLQLMPLALPAPPVAGGAAGGFGGAPGGFGGAPAAFGQPPADFGPQF